MKIFGFEFTRQQQQMPVSVVNPVDTDGSTTIAASTGGYYAQVMDIDSRIKNENDLIRRYRESAQYSDCDSAIEDIVNEAIVSDDEAPVKLNMDTLEVSTQIKQQISDEFTTVLNKLDFQNKAHDIFRNFYIDGRLYYHIVVDENNPADGIYDIRPMDPRKTRKVKNITKDKSQTGVEMVTKIDEYFLYNEKGIVDGTTQGVRLPKDSVIYVTSGLIDSNSGMVLSHLHKAVKLVNQLKMMEDALVIYRIARAPERRIFYVDVGNLPKLKAEQYVNDLMNRFRNKIVYDPTTGETRSDRKNLSMMEDFWMPRREGGRGTEITTLPGAQSLGETDDIQYFQKKLFQALNVPLSRLEGQSGFSLGRSSEITRDEIKFSKFINRQRKQFSQLLLGALRIQLILKGIINVEEWDVIKSKIAVDFRRDNYYAELKDTEILSSRLNVLQILDPFVGKYFSQDWIRKNVLRLHDEEIEEINNQIVADREVQLQQAQFQGQMSVAQQEPVDNYQAQMQAQQMQQQAAMQQAQEQQTQEPVEKK